METKYKDLQWHKQNELFLLKSNNETLVTLNYKLGGKSTFSIIVIAFSFGSTPEAVIKFRASGFPALAIQTPEASLVQLSS